MKVRHTRAGGPSIHPETNLCEAEILEIDEEANEGPFGDWARCLFRTEKGIVGTLISPEYAPGSDLEILAAAALDLPPRELPDDLDTKILLGRYVMIRVVRGREHGADCAIAQVTSQRKRIA